MWSTGSLLRNVENTIEHVDDFFIKQFTNTRFILNSNDNNFTFSSNRIKLQTNHKQWNLLIKGRSK